MAIEHALSVWLDGTPVGRDQVGGKGASLGRLLALGAPVPPAFCVTTDAYRTIARELGLPARASGIRDDELDGVRAAIEAAILPGAIRQTLHDGFRALDGRSDGPLAAAVRSSATAEDSATFSFAGLHESILDVRDPASLEVAVKRCWASLWTERAISYRRQGGLATDEATIAVVVQEMVRSDVSVVIFTTDPVSDRADRLVINATWGLGEALVSGTVTPDQIVVDAGGRVVEYTIGAKATMVVPGANGTGGTREVPVPRLLREAPVLTEEQASSIAAVARQLAAQLGYEADLEGGLAGGQFYLFQARPITTLGSPSIGDAQLVA
ncbi:MAG: rifampicin phosphotransferase [Thermomicrobiales bacterium]|nr:rifampicin phosphotransferase [Thermomicrobiales bacterium]